MTTQNSPFVSVIIPFFNVAPYLEEAIESVLCQDYSDWELILADDGSTDGSSAIADRYREAHPGKITLVSHPGGANKGAAATRNLGVRHAKGVYVALLDSDDKWMKDKLAYQVAIARRYPDVALVCGASVFWRTWSARASRGTDGGLDAPADKIESVHFAELTDAFFEQHPELSRDEVANQGQASGDIILRPPFSAVLLYPLGDQSAPCPCSVLVKKDIITAVGGFVETFRGRHAFYEDQAFLVKVYLIGSVYISAEAHDYYRIREGSVMSQSAGKRRYRMTRFYFIRWFARYLETKSITDDMLQYNLRAARWKLRYPKWKRAKDKFLTIFTAH
jgi:glycosyltransferase involved in cell wall biosynthesis